MQTIYDLAIIGGGPAGVAAGVYASRKRLKTIFLTKDFLGQSSVSDGVENWIGTIKISGADLSASLEKHLRAYAVLGGETIVDIHTGETCDKIEKVAGENGAAPIFNITTPKGSYITKTVLITTGSHRRKLDIPGADVFEHKGLTYCATCDGPLFADQDVVVVGGGNAAFESAAQLLAYCKSVTLVNRSDSFRADPVTIDRLTKHPKMRILKNAAPKEVRGEKFVSSFVYTDKSAGKEVTLPATGIFIEIGSIPTSYFAKDITELDNFGRVIVDPRNQRAKTTGIWAAGDCTDGLYHQNNIAAGDAVKALEDIFTYLHA